MANFLIVVNSVAREGGSVSGMRIVDFLISQHVWIFPAYAPHLRRMRRGDIYLVYVAGDVRAFVAVARAASSPQPLQGDLLDSVKALGLSWFTYFVRIDGARKLKRPRAIRDLLPSLTFIADKKNYGLFLRAGVRQIDARDARLILGGD
jgi:EVE domain-containing protein